MPPDPPIPYLFLCNGARLSSRRKPWRDLEAKELSTDTKSGNIAIKVKEIAEALSSNVPARAADLIEIAALIYIADQLCKRTGRKAQDYGDLWYRKIRMEIAVREPEFWGREDVCGLLEHMLSFISGDSFEFGFSKHPTAAPVGEYLDFRAAEPNPEAVEKVLLFSGGLDSLAGAVREVLAEKKRVAIVSHKSVGHIAGFQKSLIGDLTARSQTHGNQPVAVSVWCHKKGLHEQDHTQRTRSFLYVVLGAVVARTFGLDAVDFFENGVVSINLPLANHEFGARATRTTHPQTLASYSKLLSIIFDRDFSVRNEFLWHTKQDVIELIDRAGAGDLVASSVSCMHTRETTRESPHCGYCSQCLSRRFAALGVCNGRLDPDHLYRNDVLLTPGRRTEDRIIAERFIGFAREVGAMKSMEEFQQQFAADLARATPYIPLAASQSIAEIFDLHVRHAEQTLGVLEFAMQKQAGARLRGQIKDGCALAFAFGAADLPAGKLPDPPKATAMRKVQQLPEARLTSKELLILQILGDETQKTLIQADLIAASSQRSHRIARSTISRALKELVDHDFVSYPKGVRKGVAITSRGRTYLTNSPAH